VSCPRRETNSLGQKACPALEAQGLNVQNLFMLGRKRLKMREGKVTPRSSARPDRHAGGQSTTPGENQSKRLSPDI